MSSPNTSATFLYSRAKLALAELLPLRNENWDHLRQRLRLDWLSNLPPTGTGVRLVSADLFQTPLDQPEIDFENEGGETYICGNPPYLGSRDQQSEQKADLELLFDKRINNWKSLDYVAGWFIKATDYCTKTKSIAPSYPPTLSAGLQVPVLWPEIFAMVPRSVCLLRLFVGPILPAIPQVDSSDIASRHKHGRPGAVPRWTILNRPLAPVSQTLSTPSGSRRECHREQGYHPLGRTQ